MSPEKRKPQFDVFLSHNSVDKPWAIKLKNALLLYGVSVWLDKDEIRPGDIFSEALEQGLANSKAMALIVSPEAMQSGWVRAEYYRALSLATDKQVRLQLIPVILREAELPGFLQDRKWVDFRNETTYAQNLNDLIWGITGKKREHVSNPTRNTPVEEAILWRLAYAFLRLEQLPSGGWARSLPKWYQTLRGDEEGRSRGFEYRKIGGMNLTCLALLNYTRSLCSIIQKKPEDYLDKQKNSIELEQFLNELYQIEERNKVGEHAARHIHGRINTEGAIPDQWVRNPDRDVHHTLLGIIVLLLTYFLSACNCEATLYEDLRKMCRYLKERGREVPSHNYSHDRRYEIYCTLKFLEHLLEYDFFKTEDPGARKALNELQPILAEIYSRVSDNVDSNTYPEVDQNASGFLMNLPLLWNLSGNDLREVNPNFTKVPLRRISASVDSLVKCTLGGEERSPDWGHTAEYWWASTRLGKLSVDTTQRVLQTLAAQITNHSAFLLTHGISLSSVLGICHSPAPQDLQMLDEQVNNVLKYGATERNLLSLILWIYCQEYPAVSPLYKDLNQDRNTLEAFQHGQELYQTIGAIKNLFVDKLQSGFYIPTNKEQPDLYTSWQGEIKKSCTDTKKFFEDDLSEQNTVANEQRLPDKKWFHLSNYLDGKTAASGEWVLDVGCGSGIHAIKQFLPAGYRVHFYDYSERILGRLKGRLEAEKFSESQYQFMSEDIESLPVLWRGRKSALKPSYKIIFADGVLFHISKELIPDILSCFYAMLSNNGLFFTNFKINDHTLIGIDGRRFEYYASHDEIQRMIEKAGFHVEEVVITSKISSMYNCPYPTQWAHFISSKR